jgi:hypothetical protein
MTNQTPARDKAGRRGVAERLAVPLKPGNAGEGKGPQFKTDVGEGLYLGACSLRSATRKLSESATRLKVVARLPRFALLNFPQYPMQRYKTFIFPVRR